MLKAATVYPLANKLTYLLLVVYCTILYAVMMEIWQGKKCSSRYTPTLQVVDVPDRDHNYNSNMRTFDTSQELRNQMRDYIANKMCEDHISRRG